MGDHEEYEVEEVIDSQIRKKQLEYRIRWKEYSESDDTWEPIGNLEHSRDVIGQFHQEFPEAIRPTDLQQDKKKRF